jgi:TDG/mug DNA glycosylase family protein
VAATASDVPDVLAPDLHCVFCGINPGRASAAAAAHFANPRNDFWRLLHDAGFTPRRYDPQEQFALLALGYGVTNAAYRTTPGSGDLRRRDFDAGRLERLAAELRPRAIAFVGKEAYRGAFGERPVVGPQPRVLGDTALFVLPSTSPANAAVPYAERLRAFEALRTWLEPVLREAVRALVVDAEDRVLLMRWERSPGDTWWITPGGGVLDGESDEAALRRELVEEAGLEPVEIGPAVWRREHVLPFGERIVRQRERFHLLRVESHDVSPALELEAENVTGHRWWTLDELATTAERVSPRGLATYLRELLRDGPPGEPVDVGV